MFKYEIKKINNYSFLNLAGVMTANHSHKSGIEASARVLQAAIR